MPIVKKISFEYIIKDVTAVVVILSLYGVARIRAEFGEIGHFLNR